MKIFNFGNCLRDFTYVYDIVRGVELVMQSAPEKVGGEDGLPLPPFRVYNTGNNHPKNLLDFVQILPEKIVVALYRGVKDTNAFRLEIGDIRDIAESVLSKDLIRRLDELVLHKDIKPSDCDFCGNINRNDLRDKFYQLGDGTIKPIVLFR